MRNIGAAERMIDGLSNETQKLLQTYVKEVNAAFGDQLEGLLLYGSAVRGEFLKGRSNLNILLLVSSYDSAVLKQYSLLHRRWSQEQIVVPLFLTEEELRMSAAVFPLEFLEIQEQHRVLDGRDPFIGFHDNFTDGFDCLNDSSAARSSTSSWAFPPFSLRGGDLGCRRAAETGSTGVAGCLVA
jgi:hypothetical protein